MVNKFQLGIHINVYIFKVIQIQVFSVIISRNLKKNSCEVLHLETCKNSVCIMMVSRYQNSFAYADENKFHISYQSNMLKNCKGYNLLQKPDLSKNLCVRFYVKMFSISHTMNHYSPSLCMSFSFKPVSHTDSHHDLICVCGLGHACINNLHFLSKIKHLFEVS